MNDALPTRAAGWRSVLWPGFAALVAVMGIGRFVYTPILPDMLADGTLTLRSAGWVASANFAGYLAGAVAASAVRDARAQARLARAGLVATVVALAAMAVVGSVPGWIAVRFVAGVASAFGLVFASAQVLERLVAIGAADRSIWLYTGVGVGIALSAALAQAVGVVGLGWPAAWLASALLAAAFAAAAWTGAGGTPAPARAVGGVAARAPALAPAVAPAAGLAATVAAYGLFGLGYVIHATYLPAMVRAAGYPPSAAAACWVLVGLVALPSTAAWRAAARRFGARATIAACYAVEGVTALAPLVSDSIVAALIAAVGLGATFIPVTGLALPYARGLDPARASRTIGVMTAAFGAGQIVGPVAAAELAGRAADGAIAGGPFGPASVLACAALLVAAALTASATPRISPRGSPS